MIARPRLPRPARSSSIAIPASSPVVTGCAAVGRLERRLEPRAERVVSAERVRNADVAGEDRSDGQHDQRDRHRPGRIVQVRHRVHRAHGCAGCTCACTGAQRARVRMVRACVHAHRVHRAPVHRCTAKALFAVEREVHEPEHVGRRQQRRQRRRCAHSTWWPCRNVSNRISSFEKKPARQRHAGDRDRRDHERPVGDRQVLLQAAHVADVLLAVQRVNHRARAEEQAGLEERVRVEMEDAGAERADAHRQEHVAELRHRRIREHALDVVLHQADRAGKERRRRADRPRRSSA